MLRHRLPRVALEHADAVAPRAFVFVRDPNRSKDVVDDEDAELVLARDVVVERHHRDVQRLGDLPHRDVLEPTNTYLVTRLDLIHEVVADPETYSSKTNTFLHVAADGTPGLRDALGDEPIAEGLDVAVVATADPPKHTQQRRILTPLFGKNALARREDEFRELVDRALDPYLETGRVEWMNAIAEPLPSVMVARILG